MSLRNVGGGKLTSKEVARLLGVSEASVKRWADGGLLPTEKTLGGHRRFRPEDVALFRREGIEGFKEARQRIRAKPSADDSTILAALRARRIDDDEALAQSLFDALINGRNEEASALLVDLYLHGRSVATISDSILSVTMKQVGDRWYAGELSIVQEHLATRTALAALQSLKNSLTPQQETSRTALCCSVEGDFHEAPIQIAALVFESLGWVVVNIGTHTPIFAVAEAIGRFKPELVCIASTILVDRERTAREYTELRRAAAASGTAIVLGGAGFADEQTRRRFPADLYAANFRQLEDYARALPVMTVLCSEAPANNPLKRE